MLQMNGQKVYHFVYDHDSPHKTFTNGQVRKWRKENAYSGKIFVTIPTNHFGPIHTQKRIIPNIYIIQQYTTSKQRMNSLYQRDITQRLYTQNTLTNNKVFLGCSQTNLISLPRWEDPWQSHQTLNYCYCFMRLQYSLVEKGNLFC